MTFLDGSINYHSSSLCSHFLFPTIAHVLHSAIVDARGAQLIILTAGEEALGIALVDDKDDFGRHLSTQERCLLHTRDTGILPLGEVLRRLHCLDACGRLAEAAVALVQARVGAGNLEVWV